MADALIDFAISSVVFLLLTARATVRPPMRMLSIVHALARFSSSELPSSPSAARLMILDIIFS